MAKAKTKGTTDMYFVLWNENSDSNDNIARINAHDSATMESYIFFSSEREAVEYIRKQVSDDSYTQGFYSVAKLTRTVHVTKGITLKEVA